MRLFYRKCVNLFELSFCYINITVLAKTEFAELVGDNIKNGADWIRFDGTAPS